MKCLVYVIASIVHYPLKVPGLKGSGMQSTFCVWLYIGLRKSYAIYVQYMMANFLPATEENLELQQERLIILEITLCFCYNYC